MILKVFYWLVGIKNKFISFEENFFLNLAFQNGNFKEAHPLNIFTCKSKLITKYLIIISYSIKLSKRLPVL